MLIDSSYFTEGPRHILNAGGSVRKPALPAPGGVMPMADSLAVDKAIEAYVADLQEPFLKEMLGKVHGNKAHTYLVALEEDEEPKRNAHYDEAFDRLREAFADYVFYHILRDSNTQATATGLVRLKCANEYVAPLRRQVSVWNRMVERNCEFAEWAHSCECPLKDTGVSENMLTPINHFNI